MSQRMFRLLHMYILALALSANGMAQDSAKAQKTTKKLILTAVQTGLWGGTFYSLNKAWYSNYPRSSFHFYNDGKEWQQMDKVGHFWSTYQISNHTSKIWQWAGMEKKKAVIIGSISGMAYLSIIEVLDGFSDKWGFSMPDILANTSGAALFAAQELGWDQQKFSIKLSYSPYRYGVLQPRANALFGSSDAEKVLKDYNGQTYWASANLRSFFPSSGFPSWFNIAIGYGARTMLGGYENKWTSANGSTISRPDIQRYRRFFLSADVDLSKIKTKSKPLKTIFSLVNVLKIPAPAIELNSLRKLSLHPLYY